MKWPPDRRRLQWWLDDHGENMVEWIGWGVAWWIAIGTILLTVWMKGRVMP